MPPAEDDALWGLAEAIADGRPVSWDAALAGSDPATHPVVREFQVLAALADVYRRVNLDDPDADGVAPVVAEALDLSSTWGPFELKSVLGRGSFGTVYRARDPKLERDVALKLVPATDASPAERVVAEGRRLARVRHPNVITVFGADVFNGVAGMWMELLEGHTLHDERRERGALGAGEAALVGIDLCQALAAVHHAGLVHRDVKPQNVMRQEGGRIVLMDFGAGRELATPGAQAGTPLYMAPELLEGAGATVASDIYSLGVLLFHLVTGEYPVPASDLEDLQAAHRSNRRRKLRDVRPDLPSAFIRTVERATAATPADRPASAAAMEEQLEAVVVRREASKSGGMWSLLRSRTALVAALLLVLSLAVWNTPALRRTIAPAGPVTPVGPAAIRSLVVLPFANHTGNPEQEYVADGLTQLISDNLAQLELLRVISRTSAMAYKAAGKSVPTIAAELKVEWILEGSVRRSRDGIQVSVRLVRANDDPVWSHTYERPASDLFKVQGDISAMVADAIVSLTDEQRRGLTDAPAVSVRAQEAFLRGWQRLNDLRPENLKLALADLTEATELDPNSARAQAALSQCYVLLHTGELLTSDEAYREALRAATRAIQIDDRVAEAHTQLAEAKFYYEWDWELAEREYARAIELNGNNSHALARYSMFLSALGKHDEALSHAARAQENDPYSTTVRFAPGMSRYYARQYDEAITEFRRLVELPPYALLPPDRVGLARTLSAVGLHAEAIEHLEAAMKQWGRRPTAWEAEIARIHAVAGNTGEARRILRELSEGPGGAATLPANLAFVHIALGELSEAFEQLERAALQRSPALLWANVDPRFDPVRGDKRFLDLAVRIGLPVNQ